MIYHEMNCKINDKKKEKIELDIIIVYEKFPFKEFIEEVKNE